MFGDNDVVVNSSMNPYVKPHKRHVTLSFHRVKEDISDKIIFYHFIDGKNNPADVLSKNWAHHNEWAVLKPLLF